MAGCRNHTHTRNVTLLFVTTLMGVNLVHDLSDA